MPIRRTHLTQANYAEMRNTASLRELAQLEASDDLVNAAVNDDFIAIDFETATKDGMSASQLGAVRFRERQPCDSFNRLIRPPFNKHNDFNVSLTGITAEMTENEASFPEVWNDFTTWVRNENEHVPTMLVAHHAPFDMGVIKRASSHYDYDPGNWPYVCSKLLTQAVLPNVSSYKLTDLRETLELNNAKAHDAVNDATACGGLTARLLNETDAANVLHLAAMCEHRTGWLQHGSADWQQLVGLFGKEREHQNTPVTTPTRITKQVSRVCVSQRTLTGEQCGRILPLARETQLIICAGGHIAEPDNKQL